MDLWQWINPIPIVGEQSDTLPGIISKPQAGGDFISGLPHSCTTAISGLSACSKDIFS